VGRASSLKADGLEFPATVVTWIAAACAWLRMGVPSYLPQRESFLQALLSPPVYRVWLPDSGNSGRKMVLSSRRVTGERSRHHGTRYRFFACIGTTT
jgi:hypothetical protein